MLRLDHRPPPNPISTQGGAASFADGDGCVLNVSPRLSSTFHDQTYVWSGSQMTPCFTSLSSDITPNSKSFAELIKEITSIEIEIFSLERYLLSLYRTAFEQHCHGLEKGETPSLCNIESPVADQSCDKRGYDCHVLEGITGSNLQQVANPSSRRERKSGNRSLGDHLGTPCTADDRLSQDIVRCITSIYIKLGDRDQDEDPNQCHQGPSDSSTSSFSSSSTTSTTNLSDTWSPQETTHDAKYEKRGPYEEMIQVLKIGSLDGDRFNYAAKMLKHFRTLIKKLEKIDPGKMKREQKLAFWINIHNALVMHAHLAYGAHNNSRTNSIFKATYNVGGHCINAFTIQSSILGIRSHFKASWIQSLGSRGRKFTASRNQHVYAIECPEPLVHFALSSGTFSDPAVRVYNAKNIFEDLRVAKDDFIRSSTYVHKGSKIYVAKILYYFAKDMALTIPGVLGMVTACLSESQQQAIERSVKGNHVCWLLQSSVFRYVIHRDSIIDQG